MLQRLALLALLTGASQAKNVGTGVKGHWAAGMSTAASSCAFTFTVTSSATCQQVADVNSMSLAAFAALNSGIPGVACGADGSGLLAGNLVVCIASEVAQDPTTGEATNASGTVLPKLGSANRPDFNGTMPLRRNATASTSATSVSGSATSATVSITADPSATTGAPATEATTAAAPPPPPQGAPCSIYDGSCVARAGSDSPPDYSNNDLATQCLALANFARQLYNPGTWSYTWDPTLASYAQGSADYASTYNCNECHTNSGPGTSWGQNLYLGQCSCQSAYYGWVTNEALGQDPANPDEGHFLNVVGLDIPYQSMGCASSSVGGVCATVCNYGL
ncbi:hypothetical protein HDU98_001516 [Podochytrium sp. JEL0797]|nr:hypothetical protein HDU98_001516 [Podochytrium sp. JEL0797]